MHRILQFRNELMTLWRAFMAPGTPLWLKGLMLIVPLYLISPIDLIPDFIPLAGWLDDLVIVPLLVSWLVSLLPQPATARSTYRADNADDNGGPTINGTARRL
jgi:uncharacterized membrane protein YkvA (DUF1232 family)